MNEQLQAASNVDKDVAYLKQKLNNCNDLVERAKIKRRIKLIKSALVLYRLDRALLA